MDILKLIKNKNYVNNGYNKIKGIVIENIRNGLDKYSSYGFVLVKKRRIIIQTICYSAFIIAITSIISFFINNSFGRAYSPEIYDNNRIEFYEYFDTVVAHGPNGVGFNEIDQLYKIDFISDNDKAILKEYEKEALEKTKEANDVGYCIGLGIKDGKDQIYLVCYPVRNDAIWYPKPYYEEKKVFIFDSDFEFSFDSLIKFIKWSGLLKYIGDDLSDDDVIKIIGDPNCDYSSTGGLEISIEYKKSQSYTSNKKENEKIKKESNVIYYFGMNYYYYSDTYNTRKQITIGFDVDAVIRYESEGK